MKVLIVGSGGREHALAWKIAQSPLLSKLYAAPGNAGIAQIAECVLIQPEDIQELLSFAKREKIDLTVVGPESPLVAGITDVFEKQGLRVFGPSKDAALLEGSKAFAKDQMTKFGIPTAHYEIFTNENEAKHYVIETEMPVVIKADGLASGKGVIICQSSQDAVAALNKIMTAGVFGEAGSRVVIEKMLEGEELSILALSDGQNIIPLASARDHKRAYDHDRGPNTGGMGSFSPCPPIDDAKTRQIAEQVIRPMIQGMAREGKPYRGVLYAGLMISRTGEVHVLEYNCRFGDPETQSILPRLKSDLLPVLAEIAEGKLKTDTLEWTEQACLAVVMASGGYPGVYNKGYRIYGIEAAASQPDVFVFHAGTAFSERKEFITAGGRVLAVAALGESLKGAHDRAYQAVGQIHFEQSFIRRDIGRRTLEVLR